MAKQSTIRSKAKITNPQDMTAEQKVLMYEEMFKHMANVLTTVPPLREKKNANRTRARIEYRELPEWVQEWELLYESAPPNLYHTKADLMRCMMRMAMYLTTIYFSKSAEETLPCSLENLESSKHMQTMLQSLARNDMAHDIIKQYDEVRKSWINKKPRDLGEKLRAIDDMEKEHLKLVMISPDHDDIASKATLCKPAGYYSDEFGEAM